MGRKRLQGVVLTFMTALGVGLPCSATAAAASPAWRIDALSNTTAAPGGTLDYLVQATNAGGADSDGSQLDLVATLPAGVTAVSTANESAGVSFACTGPGGSAVAGASVVTCTATGVVPGMGFRTVRLTVAVAPDVTGSVTGSFQVSGGGIASASTVDPTRITAAPPGFGVDAFDGQVTDPDGDPFTQAAGHPFAASTAIDLNTTTNPDPPFGPLWPVEPVKDVRVDLPAGFIASPMGMNRCTATQLTNAQGAEPEPLCPASSQVGTTLVRLNDLPGPVVLGPLPVFNMVPAPDEPAQLGFDVAGTVVTLDGAASQRVGLRADAERRGAPGACAGWREPHVVGGALSPEPRCRAHLSRAAQPLARRSDMREQRTAARVPAQPDVLRRRRPADHPEGRFVDAPRRVQERDVRRS